MAYDRATRQVILVGDPSGSPGSQTWAWTEQAGWKQLAPAHSLPGRTWGNAVYDDATSSVILFGGQTATAVNGVFPALDDTWSWNGTDWTQLSPATSPPPTVNMPMDYEGWSRTVVGVRDNGEESRVETWQFDGSTWSRLQPAQSPLFPKSFAALAYAPAISASMLFGTEYGLNLPAADQTTWTRSSGTWLSAASNPTDPQPREFPGMATDSAGGVLMFGGGAGDGTALNDTYEWAGAWAKRTPATSPAARAMALMAHDSTCKLVVLYGGEIDTQSSLTQFADTWVWDGQTWTKVG